ncbi:hypothetical protein LMG31506_06333 [Cupriavidus yeoncheonensis]|uniref:Transposase n=1 Tax=Cupriavidus yeoncheonensis TaxID=1462994 RepID=A0A916NGB9_9BURK|nr:Mu transposase C-terminal domain-containing protein [Cupriavidus yeoncheonensis]CAG2158331.1 hypothetical protein LMG31506_06333 [Cupriavidus yeoncheonensis]
MPDRDPNESVVAEPLPVIVDAMLFRSRHDIAAQTYRVVWTGRGSLFTFFVPLHEKPKDAEWPLHASTTSLRERLAPGYKQEDALSKVGTAPPAGKSEPLSPDAKKRKKWIAPLVTDPDLLFQLLGPERGRLIEARAKELTASGDKVSRQTLGDWIRRYLHAGFDFAAMEEMKGSRGGTGKPRNYKPGRPRTVKAGTGTPVNEDTLPILLAAEDIRDAERCSLTSALKKANDLHCPDWPPEELLTDRQYQHWRNKTYSFSVRTRKRVGSQEYNLNYRRFDGTVEVDGPGARFQIDATVADVYLVSMLDRTRVVGRPTLYFVSDTYSRMIVGFRASFAPASYFGAALALESVVQSKVALCQQYGIPICEADWPAHYLPARIQGDGGGDVTAKSWKYLSDNHNVNWETAPPFRGDWKSVVEGAFNFVPTMWGEFLPGHIEKDYQKRGGPNYKLDAKLTLPGFRKWCLCNILKFIHRPIERRLQSPGMLREKIAPTPVEWWNYGVESGNSSLKLVNPDDLRASIYPRVEATVTHRGIEFLHRCYETPLALQQEWFEKARPRTFKVTMAYDHDDPREAYVIHPNRPPEKTTLRKTGAQWHFAISESEMKCFDLDAARNLNDAKDDYVATRRRFDKAAADVLAEEKALHAEAMREAGRKKVNVADMNGAVRDERAADSAFRTGYVPLDETAGSPSSPSDTPLHAESPKPRGRDTDGQSALRALREASRRRAGKS